MCMYVTNVNCKRIYIFLKIYVDGRKIISAFRERNFSLNINVLTARLVQSLKCDRRLEGKCASSLMIADARRGDSGVSCRLILACRCELPAQCCDTIPCSWPNIIIARATIVFARR